MRSKVESSIFIIFSSTTTIIIHNLSIVCISGKFLLQVWKVKKEHLLLMDGATSTMNPCVQVDGKSYIVDVKDTGATKKTAEFLSKKCSDIIQTVEKKNMIGK